MARREAGAKLVPMFGVGDESFPCAVDMTLHMMQQQKLLGILLGGDLIRAGSRSNCLVNKKIEVELPEPLHVRVLSIHVG